MLARKTSCSLNGISLLRTGGNCKTRKLQARSGFSRHLRSDGTGVSDSRTSPNCSVVWNFAENREGAKQFLADLIDNSKAIYAEEPRLQLSLISEDVPDLIVRLENDATGDPPFKYKELKDALHWTHNLGFPGYATPYPWRFQQVCHSQDVYQRAKASSARKCGPIWRKRITKIAENGNRSELMPVLRNRVVALTSVILLERLCWSLRAGAAGIDELTFLEPSGKQTVALKFPWQSAWSWKSVDELPSLCPRDPGDWQTPQGIRPAWLSAHRHSL